MWGSMRRSAGRRHVPTAHLVATRMPRVRATARCAWRVRSPTRALLQVPARARRALQGSTRHHQTWRRASLVLRASFRLRKGGRIAWCASLDPSPTLALHQRRSTARHALQDSTRPTRQIQYAMCAAQARSPILVESPGVVPALNVPPESPQQFLWRPPAPTVLPDYSSLLPAVAHAIHAQQARAPTQAASQGLAPATSVLPGHSQQCPSQAPALSVLPDYSSPLLARAHAPNATAAWQARGKRVAVQLRATARTVSPASTLMHRHRHALSAPQATGRLEQM